MSQINILMMEEYKDMLILSNCTDDWSMKYDLHLTFNI